MNHQPYLRSFSETNSNPKRVSRGLKPKEPRYGYQARYWAMVAYKKSRNANDRRRRVTKKARKRKSPTAIRILKTEKKETPIPNARYQCKSPIIPYPKKTP